MEIGDLIRYTGIVIITNVTWESLYNELAKGKQYEILDIKHLNRDGYILSYQKR